MIIIKVSSVRCKVSGKDDRVWTFSAPGVGRGIDTVFLGRWWGRLLVVKNCKLEVINFGKMFR